MKIKGILTNRATNDEKEVELEYEINENDRHELTFKLTERLDNNVPLYVYDRASFYIEDHAIKNMSKFGWMVYVGWDKLFIPAEEMQKALKDVEQTPKLTYNMKTLINLKYLTEQRDIKQKEIEYINDRIKELRKELGDKCEHT